jgi:hypothetical protein
LMEIKGENGGDCKSSHQSGGRQGSGARESRGRLIDENAQ